MFLCSGYMQVQFGDNLKTEMLFYDKNELLFKTEHSEAEQARIDFNFQL